MQTENKKINIATNTRSSNHNSCMVSSNDSCLSIIFDDKLALLSVADMSIFNENIGKIMPGIKRKSAAILNRKPKCFLSI